RGRIATRRVEQSCIVLLVMSAAACAAAGRRESSSQVAAAQMANGSVPRADDLLAAAFKEFAKSRDAYAQLHHHYLAVTQPAPDPASCASWPDGELGSRVLRLGFVAEEPLHTVEASGRHVGLEADLATELVRRIN